MLLNTCAIREHAEDRVFGNLGALTHTKKENPEQVICLCGCMAQEPRVSERIKKSYPHVDLVFGPQALWKFPELLWQVYETKKRVFSVQDEHGTIAEGIPVVRELSLIHIFLQGSAPGVCLQAAGLYGFCAARWQNRDRWPVAEKMCIRDRASWADTWRRWCSAVWRWVLPFRRCSPT